MSPGFLSPSPTPSQTSGKQRDNNNASKYIFPDGIRTSGQHNPIYDLLRPYEAFPSRIEGPTVWTREEYANHSERWTHHFTQQELAELSKASDDFIAAGTTLAGISTVGRATFGTSFHY